MRAYAFALIALLFVACGRPPDKVVVNRIVEAKLVSIEPPKRFHVTVEVEGTVYSGVARSKRCTHWQRNKVGDVHRTEMIVRETQDSDGKVYRYAEFPKLNSALCR